MRTLERFLKAPEALLEAPRAENERPSTPCVRPEPGRAGQSRANQLLRLGEVPPLKILISLGSIIVGSLAHRVIGSLKNARMPGV